MAFQAFHCGCSRSFTRPWLHHRWFEAAVDLYFVGDLALNFRTALSVSQYTTIPSCRVFLSQNKTKINNHQSKVVCRFRSMLIAEGHSNVQRIVVMMSGCTKQYYRLPLLLTARPNLAECGDMRIASAATTRVESWRRSQLKSRTTISKACGALSPQSVWCLLIHD